MRTARWVGFRTEALGIDLDTAHTEQTLHPVADRRVQGLGKDGIRGFLRQSRLPGLLHLGRFLASASQRQQSHHVGLRQGRFGAIFHIQLTELSIQVDGDVVIADAGGHLKIEDRGGCDRVHESHVTTFQAVLSAVEIHVAFDDVGASQQDRFGGAAPHVQVGISRETDNRGLHLQFRCRSDVDVQPDSIQQRIGLRQGGSLRAALEIGSKVEAWRHGQLGDGDIT